MAVRGRVKIEVRQAAAGHFVVVQFPGEQPAIKGPMSAQDADTMVTGLRAKLALAMPESERRADMVLGVIGLAIVATIIGLIIFAAVEALS